MKRPKLPAEGSCRCGETGLRITASPIMTAVCHCGGCQKMASSAFSLTAMIPAAAFEVTRGDPVVGGKKGPELSHFFCPACMTWMFTRIAGYDGFDGFVNLRPTLLDHHAWFEPFIETCTSEALRWARTPARHRFEQFPPMDRFESLMAEFAEAMTG